MKGILADNNIQGQVNILVDILESEEWRELWASLKLAIYSFEELGLARNDPDAAVWHACQQHPIVLITANRNKDAPDSLEATIEVHNRLDSLPVFTLADDQRILHSKQYAAATAGQLLDYLFDIDRVRGTGRLYIP